MNIDISLLQPYIQALGIESNILQVIIDIWAFVLPVTALCAMASLPFMALTAQALGRIRKRSFYDKCARQLAVLACILGFLSTLAGGWQSYCRLESAASYPFIVQGHTLWWLCLACSTLCMGLYVSLWKPLRSLPLLHQLFALLAGCLGAFSLYAHMALLEAESFVDQGLPAPTSLWAVLTPENAAGPSILWNILCYLPALAVGLGAGLGAIWLLLRRHRDDYGRDHYNTMVPWCALWARNAWIVLWCVLLSFSLLDIYLGWQDTKGALDPQIYIFEAVHLLLWALPALLWTMAVRSPTPLRHKFTLLLALCIAMGFTVPLALALL